ncbi:hypothetical protein PBI_MYXUS_72 [Mycobacterium phage Myxus]|uniref:Uncharacterized protein n=9 Tax=Fromanvirus TaxID=186764 RepID=A0A142K4X8_9CAUD|nr:hypothetical protein CM07_gp36 [Mycobacterium phage Alma]YP_009214738.1 hypothetical protein AVV05_gp037 [Mycobacterium phage Pioneer]YP_009636041.1 hypothetical protein FGG56_gp32 [Mycobacterium phage PackMan]AMO43940.1 hypothetical protein PBI_MYXUS_72 [Mycobacterium phage Myxus]AMS00870.1 hypothetical protein PBI_EIDSMOE_70 [Mycobacterium phage Eidsmoe]AOQ29029.1 hypothetical protein SEA_HORTUMSL17_73 [Mycobacterium phage HortumSL17]AOT26187.1 hypothetical protein SEA_QOBBIT_70 [Mycobac
MKVRLKISEQEALVVKDALQRHAFDAGWYRRREADICHAVASKIGRKLDTHQGG